ncbi:hypothetical protein F2P81_005132 [Scophthalmus maximus]|uniref:Uncharacterized protein n=1 Tax=Scophthalmus maximus TaxID=52904 RepID=A0A6A4TCR3_SCOMX|nr:hypothetical protein F2P81_005132 [Scophthalmus maximus]
MLRSVDEEEDSQLILRNKGSQSNNESLESVVQSLTSSATSRQKIFTEFDNETKRIKHLFPPVFCSD